jgi:hypothetical protein
MSDDERPETSRDNGAAKIKFSQVLEAPPYKHECETSLGAAGVMPALPRIQLPCEVCGTRMLHDGRWAHEHQRTDNAARMLSIEHQVALYTCRHCGQQLVTIPLKFTRCGDGYGKFIVTKIGQHPKHSPRVPTRVKKFMASDAEWQLYLKGWACEKAGAGIGAYAYYRRVVDHHWSKLLDRLIAAAKRLGDAESEAELVSAKGDWKFAQAVDLVAPAVPKKLMIKTANPLTLLHDALSNGVHNLDDETCLKYATAGREVLEKLLELMHEALKEEKNLDEAVALLQAARKRPTT